MLVFTLVHYYHDFFVNKRSQVSLVAHYTGNQQSVMRIDYFERRTFGDIDYLLL